MYLFKKSIILKLQVISKTPFKKRSFFILSESSKKNLKPKGVKENYRTNYIKNVYKEKIYENIKIDLKNKKIILPKLKEVKIKKEGYKEKALENAMIHILLKRFESSY